MPKEGKENEGMRKLIGYYKAIFRKPENLNHYSESDFRSAEKKFLGHEPNNGQGEMGN
jgi:hypothetical protein